MKITAEYLHRKWKSISYYDGGYIQVEVKHPWSGMSATKRSIRKL